MKGLLNRRFWLHIIISLLFLISMSEESCEMYKKTISAYRMERVLYRYVVCVNMTPESDLRSEILSKLNSSSQFLEISNSSTPELTKDIFMSMNLTQLTMEAQVEIIQDKAFERSNISKIILDNNEIKRIKNSAFKSIAIYELSLKNNSISQISDQTFIGLGNLRKLYLQNNRIVNVQPNSLKDLISLEELNLSYNQLSVLPQHLFENMGLLQTIYLNNNYLKQISKNQFLKNSILQYLKIQKNFLTNLDATLFPPSLRQINAEKNQLESFNISNLINLNKIILDDNKIRSTQDSLKNLTSLGFLHMNNNFLGTSKRIDTLEHLKNMSVIEIDNNNLDYFDFSVLRNLPQLTGISLVDNNLTYVNLTEVPSGLTILNLSSNSLVELKNLSNLNGLLRLELSHNNIEDIPFDMFTKLYQLQTLSLSYNDLKKLSLGCFRDLRTLSYLNLSHNRLVTVSIGSFGGLNAIVELDISYNNLNIFDEDTFHNMRSLRYLSIAYNNLSNVNIRRIVSHTLWLNQINLKGNNWTCKALANVVRENRLTTVVEGDHFNVSNIFGMPCTDVNEDEEMYVHDKNSSIEILKSTKLYVSEISFKLSILNATTIITVIIFCCKVLYDKYSKQISVAKQFIYKKTGSDQEIHLI